MVEITSFSNFLETIGVLCTLIFVLTSMLGMGFSLTVQQILAPLSNWKLVILSLAANFILGPAAYSRNTVNLSALRRAFNRPTPSRYFRRSPVPAEACTGSERGHWVFRRIDGAPDGGDDCLRADSPAAFALRGYNKPLGHSKVPHSTDALSTGSCPVSSGPGTRKWLVGSGL